jgi:hypothetical protein
LKVSSFNGQYHYSGNVDFVRAVWSNQISMFTLNVYVYVKFYTRDLK